MSRELSYSAYVVLGLIARYGPMTPYDLKAKVEQSVGRYWPIPHAQLYRDPERLTELGLLSEEAESHGRRRRVFSLTETGREVLHAWLVEPRCGQPENRDPSLLKLTFIDLVSDRHLAALAKSQAAQHNVWLEDYLRRRAELDVGDEGHTARDRLLDLGIRYERAYLEFWESIGD
jgi:DNA-binding PadR family transcriptional regulator